MRGAKTAKDVVATGMAVSKQIKKVGVISGVCDGFIGNRMMNAYFRQMELLLDVGALPQQIDRAIEKFGFAMGPFRVSDLAGNDILWYIRKRMYVEYPDRVFSKIPDRICELGRFGQKTGAGWYDYKAGDRTPIPSDVVNQIVLEESARLGLPRRKIGDEEIVQRALYSLDQRRRAHSRGGHRGARLGHRRRVPDRLWISRLSRRPAVLCRYGRLGQYPAHDGQIRDGIPG